MEEKMTAFRRLIVHKLSFPAALVAALLASSFCAAAGPATPLGPEAVLADELPLSLFGEVVGLGNSSRPQVSIDSNVFITEDGDTVYTMSLKTLKPLCDPIKFPGLTHSRLSGSGKFILTCNDKEACRWEISNHKMGNCVKIVSRNNGYIEDVEFSTDGTRYITIEHGSNAAKLWKVGEKVPTALLRHESKVLSAQFDPACRFVVSHEVDGKAPFHVWSLKTFKEVVPPIISDGEMEQFRLHCAHFDSEGKRLVLPRKSGFAIIDLVDGKRDLEVTYNPNGDFRTATVDFSNDGSRVVVTRLNGLVPATAQVYEADTGELLQEFGGNVKRCDLIGNGSWALCSPIMQKITDAPELYSIKTGAKMGSLPAPIDFPYVSPDGSFLFMQLHAGKMAVYRIGAIPSAHRSER